MEPVDLTDPEYAIPSEAAQWIKDGAASLPTLPPRTGPELAGMRLDSMEERLRLLEHRVRLLEHTPSLISSSYLYIPVGPGTVPASPSHNHNEGF